MKTIVIDVIEDVPVNLYLSKAGDEMLIFRSGMMIDADGSGPETPGDTFQPDTTLHRDGKALNAWEEPFIVVPPIVCEKTEGLVLGSLALVQNLSKDLMCFAVVGDIGPHRKIGEASPYCAKQLGIDPSPTKGGTREKIIRYTIFVGVPAVVGDKHYVLQKYG